MMLFNIQDCFYIWNFTTTNGDFFFKVQNEDVNKSKCFITKQNAIKFDVFKGIKG